MDITARTRILRQDGFEFCPGWLRPWGEENRTMLLKILGTVAIILFFI